MTEVRENEVGPSWDDIRNLLQMISKRFDEREELMDKGFNKLINTQIINNMEKLSNNMKERNESVDNRYR